MDNNISIEEKNIRISFMDFVNSLRSFFTTSTDMGDTELENRIRLIENEEDKSQIEALEKYVTAYKSAKKATKGNDKKQKVQIIRENEQSINTKNAVKESKEFDKSEDNELSI